MSGRGGARPGSGRKKGSTNVKVSAERLKAAIQLRHGGLGKFSEDVNDSDPLDTIELLRKVLLQAYHDTSDIEMLMEAVSAAEKSAPYLHAKRQNVTTEDVTTNPDEEKSSEELMSDVFGPNARPLNADRPN